METFIKWFTITILFICLIIAGLAQGTLLTVFNNTEVNRLLDEFPLQEAASHEEKNIYQILTSSQWRPDSGTHASVCPLNHRECSCIYGSTCGRHALKNGILGFLFTDLYNSFGQVAVSEQGTALDLLKRYSNSISKLTPDAQCLLYNISDLIQQHRAGAQGTDLLIQPEIEHVLKSIQPILNTCKLSPIQITTLPRPHIEANTVVITGLHVLTEQELLMVTPEWRTDLPELAPVINAIQELRNAPNSTKLFILGSQEATGDHHWIAVLAIKRDNGPIQFLLFDSNVKSDSHNDKTRDSVTERFVDFVNNPLSTLDKDFARTRRLLSSPHRPNATKLQTFGYAAHLFKSYNAITKKLDALSILFPNLPTQEYHSRLDILEKAIRDVPAVRSVSSLYNERSSEILDDMLQEFPTFLDTFLNSRNKKGQTPIGYAISIGGARERLLLDFFTTFFDTADVPSQVMPIQDDHAIPTRIMSAHNELGISDLINLFNAHPSHSVLTLLQQVWDAAHYKSYIRIYMNQRGITPSLWTDR